MQLHQLSSVIKLPLELAKGCQKAYNDLLIRQMSVSHMYSFLLTGKYLPSIREWFNNTETAQGEKILTSLGFPK